MIARARKPTCIIYERSRSAVLFCRLGRLRPLGTAGKSENGEKRIVRLAAKFPGSAGPCGEPQRVENGEAAGGSEFQGHRDLLFKTIEELMPESRIGGCDVCHSHRSTGGL